MTIAIYDDDGFLTELLGEKKFKVREICLSTLGEREITLQLNGKKTADLTIET